MYDTHPVSDTPPRNYDTLLDTFLGFDTPPESMIHTINLIPLPNV